jgi:hypothetical protein
MAIVLEECNTEEHRFVACFLWAKELNANDIHNKMFPVYSRKCPSCKAVHNWVKKFPEGCLKIADDA